MSAAAPNTATAPAGPAGEALPDKGSDSSVGLGVSESKDDRGYIMRIRSVGLRRTCLVVMTALASLYCVALVALLALWAVVVGLRAFAMEMRDDFRDSFRRTWRWARVFALAFTLGWDREYATDHAAASARMDARAAKWRLGRAAR